MAELEQPITLDMIVSKNCSLKNGNNLSVEDALLRMKRVWLDKMGITLIDNLEMLGKITHLHLDYNAISAIKNLDTLANSLQHLSMRGNDVTDVGNGLSCLPHLISLDLSENKIGDIVSEQLPPKLAFLNILDNPVLERSDFNEDSLIQDLPNLKVFNNVLLGESEEDEEEEEEEEEEENIFCLQDLTKRLRETSRARQHIIEENHQNRVSTLQLIKTEMNAAKQNCTRTSNQDIPLSNNVIAELPKPGNSLPPMERPLSSQSAIRKASLLDPLPPRTPSSPSLAGNTGHVGQGRVQSPKTISSPKRTAVTDKVKQASLRQPLTTELVKVDDFDNYLADVNKQFSDLRANFEGL